MSHLGATVEHKNIDCYKSLDSDLALVGFKNNNKRDHIHVIFKKIMVTALGSTEMLSRVRKKRFEKILSSLLTDE